MNNIQNSINNMSVYYDAEWDNLIGSNYCRKEEKIKNIERKFFSQYWQGFAWSAIIGFIKNRKESLDSQKKSSFKYDVINNNAPLVADALLLMAISKSQDIDKLLQPRELLTIISEYAKGGAYYVKEILETPGKENYFDSEMDYIKEIMNRK